MTDTAATAAVPKHILVNGRRIRFRWGQMTLWSAVAGFAGACFVAGLYLLLLQVHWYVHIGSARFEIFNLKPWWDGLFSSKSWVLYRHGLRDLGEPAAATIAVMTLLAKPQWWGVRLSTLRLAITPVVLAVVAIALITGGIWLLDFGLPALWHHLWGGYRVTAPPWIARSSWQNLVLGFIIGKVLHRIWVPAGATLQGYRIDRAVNRALLTGSRPRWTGLPVVPPVLRERFSWDYEGKRLKVRPGISALDIAGSMSRPTRTNRVLMAVLAAAGLVFTVIGGIAKFWIATHHGFPYLAP